MKSNLLAEKLSEVTARTARSVMPLSGRQRKNDADHLAVETMRSGLSDLPFAMRVLLGEGEKDNAPQLYSGELLGKGKGDLLDLVVDPLECTTNFASGLPDSLSAILAAPADSMLRFPGTYMEHIVVPPQAATALRPDCLDRPVAEVYQTLRDALAVPSATVVVQNRPRHAELIMKLREQNAGIALIESGSISAACEILFFEDRYTILWGTYGAPEAVILAYLAQVSGGAFLGRIRPHTEEMHEQAQSLGVLDKIFTASDIIKQPGALAITGIHSSSWLRGCVKDRTQSFVAGEAGVEFIDRAGETILQRQDIGPNR